MFWLRFGITLAQVCVQRGTATWNRSGGGVTTHEYEEAYQYGGLWFTSGSTMRVVGLAYCVQVWIVDGGVCRGHGKVVVAATTVAKVVDEDDKVWSGLACIVFRRCCIFVEFLS